PILTGIRATRESAWFFSFVPIISSTFRLFMTAAALAPSPRSLIAGLFCLFFACGLLFAAAPQAHAGSMTTVPQQFSIPATGTKHILVMLVKQASETPTVTP